VRTLDDLLTRYPRSPLAETARIEKLRALESLGDASAARREAKGYLADYPNGSARREALAVLARGRTRAP
jgi:outer membrane protein assembly factor BamD (BamD/ComL family)